MVAEKASAEQKKIIEYLSQHLSKVSYTTLDRATARVACGVLDP